MSVIELILAFALVAVTMTPMIALLYSMLPENIVLSLGILPSHEEIDQKWYDKNILINTYVQSHSFSTQYSAQVSAQDWRLNKNICNLSSPDMRNFKKGINSVYATPMDSLPIDIGSSNTPTSISLLGDNLIASLNSSSTTDPDLLVLDLPTATTSDLSFKWSTIDTGPGLVDMQVDGFNTYIANTSIHSQAQVVDLSAQPMSVLKNLTFPIVNSSTTQTPATTKKILKYKNLLIIGTEKSQVPEIAVFDVNSGKILANIDTDYGINNLYIIYLNLWIKRTKDKK